MHTAYCVGVACILRIVFTYTYTYTLHQQQWCAFSASVAVFTLCNLLEGQSPYNADASLNALTRLLRSMDVQLWPVIGGLSNNGQRLLDGAAHHCRGLFGNLVKATSLLLVCLQCSP